MLARLGGSFRYSIVGAPNLRHTVLEGVPVSLVQFPTFLLWFCRKVCQEAWGFLSAKIADLCAPSKSIRLSVGFGL